MLLQMMFISDILVLQAMIFLQRKLLTLLDLVGHGVRAQLWSQMQLRFIRITVRTILEMPKLELFTLLEIYLPITSVGRQYYLEQ